MNTLKFADKAYDFTSEKRLFSAPCRLLVGVSGGADSMALLHALLHWPEPNICVTVVHIHHGLRGASADADAAFVREFCKSNGVSFVLRYVDVAAYAAENGLTIEEAGRQLRYDTFESVRNEVNADYVLTAHTQSDHVETVLMRIVRGSGIDGLCGILASRGYIRRPLLSCTREEVEQYCAENNVPYITDESNTDLAFTRNRIRHEALPFLRTLNPSIDDALVRLSHRATEDSDYLCDCALQAFAGDNADRQWPITAFLAQPLPVRRRMLIAVFRKCGLATYEESHIVALDKLLYDGCGTVCLPQNLTISVRQGSLFAYYCLTDSTTADTLVVDSFPFVADFGDMHFTVELSHSANVHNLFANTQLDYDKIQGDLHIRCRREGDYFHPSGRHIGKSIKKLMNEWKMPAHIRDYYPLLCDEQGIVLVPGYGCDERVRATEDTRHFLVWRTDAVQG